MHAYLLYSAYIDILECGLWSSTTATTTTKYPQSFEMIGRTGCNIEKFLWNARTQYQYMSAEQRRYCRLVYCIQWIRFSHAVRYYYNTSWAIKNIPMDEKERKKNNHWGWYVDGGRADVFVVALVIALQSIQIVWSYSLNVGKLWSVPF